MLHDPLVFISRFNHLATFKNIVRTGLFNIDVFARLAGPDCRQSMPMVGGRNRHHINVVTIQHTPKISFGFKFVFVVFFERLGSDAGNLFIRITENHNLRIGIVFQGMHVRLPTTIHAKHRGSNFAVLVRLRKNFGCGEFSARDCSGC